jgi:hypothetical protein
VRQPWRLVLMTVALVQESPHQQYVGAGVGAHVVTSGALEVRRLEVGHKVGDRGEVGAIS